jgi:site-specific DNA-methyltransferase (adenine-specific)
MIGYVHNMDCMDALKYFKDKEFDIAIIDPPYGIKESAHRNISRTKLAKTAMYRVEFWDYDIPSQKYFNELFRVSKHQIIFGINYLIGKVNIPFSSGRIVWDKCNEGTNFSDCELAYCSFHHSTRLFRFMWNGMMQGTPGNGSVMQGNKKKNQKRIHPTEKPIDIYKWILRKYAKEGDKILDTHMGSGSIQIACLEAGLSFTGFEIDKHYFDASQKRFELYKQQLSLVL